MGVGIWDCEVGFEGNIKKEQKEKTRKDCFFFRNLIPRLDKHLITLDSLKMGPSRSTLFPFWLQFYYSKKMIYW